MRYPENLIESSKGVALDSAKPSPAEMLSVLSHCLPSLYRYAYRFLRNKADAEDAVQDALTAALEHLHQFRGDAQFSTWLTTIVINCARMHLRKQSRYIHVSWIRESEKSGSILSPIPWWTTDPIPRMSPIGLCCMGNG